MDEAGEEGVTGEGVPVERRSLLTCPQCGKETEESMPLDACLYFYRCGGCGTLLRPKPGDCCVFCSYGSVLCPPVQRSLGGDPGTLC